MTTYVIYRTGSNAANQHMRHKEPVLIVDAANPEEAKAKAAELVSCYANQHLGAVPASRVSKADRETTPTVAELEANHAAEFGAWAESQSQLDSLAK